MRGRFFLSLVVLVAAIVSVPADDNEDLKAYGERMSKFFGLALPINDLKKVLNPRSNNPNREISTKCQEQVSLLVEGLKKSSVWAIRMIDASSKIPSGILIGNNADFGMYDECMEIDVHVDEQDIRGRHCMYDLSLGMGNTNVSVTLSVCLPAACEPEDVQQIVQQGLQIIDQLETGMIATPIVGQTSCSPIDPRPWTAGGIVTIIGLIALLSFLVVCTIVELFERYSSEKSHPNSLIRTIGQFSLLSNAKRLLSTKTSPGTMPAIQGLRFYSMCWVIIGHAHVLFLLNSVNLLTIFQWMSEWKAVYIMVGPFSVDTFFAISGFLMSYIFLKEMSAGHSFNIFSYYLHRYLRLTPALAALLVITIFILPRVGSGPTWENSADVEIESCKSAWWTMLLYVQNYVRTEPRGCLGHTWYLAVEMQFFWLSPLILYPLAKKPKLGLLILAACFVASVVVPVKIGWDNKYSTALIARVDFTEDSMDNFYFPSHIRAAPWLLGILFGYLSFKKKQASMITIMKWFGWLLAIVSFSFCIFTIRVFQNQDYRHDQIWEACYTAFARPLWSFTVLWIVYASIGGFGGPLKTFLSFSIYTPLCRISYCIYLVHYQLQFMRARAVRVPNFFSPFNAIDHFLSDFMMSIIVGFIFTLVFETPIWVLERSFRRKKVRSRNNEKPVENIDAVEKGISNPGLTTS